MKPELIVSVQHILPPTVQQISWATSVKQHFVPHSIHSETFLPARKSPNYSPCLPNVCIVFLCYHVKMQSFHSLFLPPSLPLLNADRYCVTIVSLSRLPVWSGNFPFPRQSIRCSLDIRSKFQSCTSNKSNFNPIGSSTLVAGQFSTAYHREGEIGLGMLCNS
jgi:hypothetical protein